MKNKPPYLTGSVSEGESTIFSNETFEETFEGVHPDGNRITTNCLPKYSPSTTDTTDLLTSDG